MVRLVTLGLALATVLSTVAGEPLLETCADDLTWRFKGEEDKDCAWVGRNANNRCDRTVQGVPSRHYCPGICNDCGDDRNTNPDECSNDPDFRFNLEETKDCLWVGRNPNNRCERSWKGSPISTWCPEYCGGCEIDRDDNNNNGPCEDDADFRFGNNPNRSCADWVADDPEIRCHERFWLGEPLSHYCPVTCDTCPEPEDDDETTEGCCSLNYRDCIDWCGTTENTCGNCNHQAGVVWLENGAPPQGTCTKRWSECETDSDSCCPGLECRLGGPKNVLACRPELPAEDEEESEEESEDEGGCCSLDYKECISWCGATKDSCLGCNHHDGVGWLKDGSAVNSQCKRRWSGCGGSPNSCCAGLECRPNENDWMACQPALSTEAPTFEPTSATSLEPTSAEESGDIDEADGCCSLDYKECIGWCGPTRDSCLGCNHHDGVGWLTNGSAVGSQCKRRWSGCGGSPNSCCDGLVCRRDPNNWLACLPELE